MVLPVIAGVTEEESADERTEVPVAANPESEHVAMWEVDHATVAVLPLSTRLGFAVSVLITPASTQVEPLCTWPLWHVQLGE
jgi:hypothetical protein